MTGYNVDTATSGATWRAADILAILASLSDDPQRVAWRFKQWQRNGQMTAPGVGRGAKYQYSTEDVWRACLLNEFQMIGLAPANAAALIDAFRGPDYRPIPGSKTTISIDAGRIEAAIDARRAEIARLSPRNGATDE